MIHLYLNQHICRMMLPITGLIITNACTWPDYLSFPHPNEVCRGGELWNAFHASFSLSTVILVMDRKLDLVTSFPVEFCNLIGWASTLQLQCTLHLQGYCTLHLQCCYSLHLHCTCSVATLVQQCRVHCYCSVHCNCSVDILHVHTALYTASAVFVYTAPAVLMYTAPAVWLHCHCSVNLHNWPTLH